MINKLGCWEYFFPINHEVDNIKEIISMDRDLSNENVKGLHK